MFGFAVWILLDMLCFAVPFWQFPSYYYIRFATILFWKMWCFAKLCYWRTWARGKRAPDHSMAQIKTNFTINFWIMFLQFLTCCLVCYIMNHVRYINFSDVWSDLEYMRWNQIIVNKSSYACFGTKVFGVWDFLWYFLQFVLYVWQHVEHKQRHRGRRHKCNRWTGPCHFILVIMERSLFAMKRA